MKKINLNIKREIKPSKPLEVTHANLEEKKEEKPTPKEEKKIKKGILVTSTNKPTKRKSYVLSLRVNEEELNKINSYLKENDTNFSTLIKTLLKEKGII